MPLASCPALFGRAKVITGVLFVLCISQDHQELAVEQYQDQLEQQARPDFQVPLELTEILGQLDHLDSRALRAIRVRYRHAPVL